MRKALFLIGLAAGVAAMPMTAAAQDHDHHEHGGGNNGGGNHGGGGGNRGGGGGGGNHGGGGGGWRGSQQPQQQQQPQVQQQQVQQQQAPQRSQWQGNRNDPHMEAARQRYERLERDNARNYGTPQQTREVIDRQRAERGNDRGNWQGGNNNNRPGGWNGGNNNRPGGWNGGRNDNRPGWNGGRNDGRPGWNGGRGRPNNWNREWRNDRRFDWQRYRNTNRFVFHIQPYYSPYRDWSYTRFGIGMFLDELLYSRNYWINDPWTYRLPPAEPGLHWVRYYNDVLLVDDYTGEVVDVIYDFFW